MKQDAATLGPKLVDWLGRRFPEAKDIVISDLRSPSGGFSNETWLLDLEWIRDGRAERQALVARLQPLVAGTFPEYDLKLQYRCMELLQDSGVPVPRLFCFCDQDSPFDVPFYLMERIDGLAPLENPPYHGTGWLHDMTPVQQGEAWYQCVDTIAAVHRVDWQARGFGFLDRPHLGATPLAQMIAYYRNYLAWIEARRRPYPMLHRALDWVESHQPQQPEPMTLCWGDAKIGNCLFQGTRCVAALDWEMPYLGNPVSDLSWLLMLDRALSEAIGIPRLPGFADRGATLARWSAASGYGAEHLPYYEVFSALKFSAIMAAITTALVSHGLMPEDTDMDLRNPGTAVLALYAGEYGLDL